MSVAHKFTFDLDLAHEPVPNKVLPHDEFEEMLASAREAGRAEGYAAGQKSAQAQAARTLAQAAQDVSAQASQMLETVETYERRHLSDAIGLAAQVGRKLAAHLIARQPAEELSQLVAECLSTLENAPHLVIRCHPDLCDAMRGFTEERMAISGLSGRLIVLGDPEIGLGDGRIEWADGGLVRDLNAISNEINSRISAFLGARGARQGD